MSAASLPPPARNLWSPAVAPGHGKTSVGPSAEADCGLGGVIGAQVRGAIQRKRAAVVGRPRRAVTGRSPSMEACHRTCGGSGPPPEADRRRAVCAPRWRLAAGPSVGRSVSVPSVAHGDSGPDRGPGAFSPSGPGTRPSRSRNGVRARGVGPEGSRAATRRGRSATQPRTIRNRNSRRSAVPSRGG